MKLIKLIKTLFKQFILIMFSVIALFSFFKMNNHLKSKKEWQSAVNQMLTAKNRTDPSLNEQPSSQAIKISLTSLENRFFAEVPKNYQSFQKQNQVLVQRQTMAILNEIQVFFAKNKDLQDEQISFYQNCSTNMQLIKFARNSCSRSLSAAPYLNITASNLEKN